MESKWQPTRHGGFRRTEVAQAQKAGKARGTERVSREGWPPQTWIAQRIVLSIWKSARLICGKMVVRICPSVLKKFTLKLNERLGLPECPYVIRWRFETPWGSIRLHHWLAPDDDRAKHDHPWSFTTRSCSRAAIPTPPRTGMITYEPPPFGIERPRTSTRWFPIRAAAGRSSSPAPRFATGDSG